MGRYLQIRIIDKFLQNSGSRVSTRQKNESFYGCVLWYTNNIDEEKDLRFEFSGEGGSGLFVTVLETKSHIGL